MRHAIALALTAALVASCAAGPPRMAKDRIERLLDNATIKAQPSRVVAAEIAYAKAVREDGATRALRAHALPTARVWRGDGLRDAATATAQGRWAPRTVMMSCDGSTAIGSGRFRDNDGKVGAFVTVWRLQSDRSYRWVFDARLPDEPQPPPPPAEAKPLEDEIVVSAIDMVRGVVADCPTPGVPPAPPPPAVMAPGALLLERGYSQDGTIAWDAVRTRSGTLSFGVAVWREGGWEQALLRDLPAAPG